MLISPGTVLGRYKIRSSIGAGGMGEVFLADDIELGRPVALKVLLDAIGDGDPVRRFIQEAKAASALNHPNILTIYEIGKFEDSRFIATEYIKGRTLRERLKGEPISGREALEIAVQIAAALDAAHEAGIVHRDIKPDNVMLRAEGLVKVLDFGLAKLAEKEPDFIDSEEATLARVQTIPGMVMGTVNYMSPEQARGREVDTRTDIWSLGVVFYEMLRGRTPFAEETTSDTMAAILKSDPAPLGDDVPPEVVRIVRKALQKNRDERYQTARDLLLDLKNLQRELEFATEFERSQHSGERRQVSGFSGALSGRVTSLEKPAAVSTNEGEAYHSAGVTQQTTPPAARPGWTVGAAIVLALGIVGAIVYFAVLAPGSGAINSIAVLPFATSAGDAADNDLADSVSEALINNLSKLPQLKVISRSSSFKYRGPDPDPQQVAKDLGVQAIVMGRFTRRGDMLQISVEMINAVDRSIIWGESYNRKITDILAVQDNIARTVSQKLRLKLSGDEEQRIAKRLTDNPQAYQLYLSGVFYARKRGVDNVQNALDYQKQAIALDPGFALAYVEMASDYTLLVGSDLIDAAEGKRLARAAVEKALQLDDTIAEAHLALARIENDNLDWAGAGRSFQRALELNPNLVSAHNLYAFHLSCLERHEDAIEEIKRAQELDPLSAGKGTEGSILYLARRYDESIGKLREAIAQDPNDTFAHAYLGLAYAAIGSYPEAISELDLVAKIQGETTSTTIYRARVYALAGQRAEALSIVDGLERTKQYVAPSEIAALYAAIGDNEKAFASLEKAFAEKDLQLQFLRVDPGYDPIRNDPRFADLLRRVGLAA